jgi:hypothetical protein
MIRRDQLPPTLQCELKVRTRTMAERAVDAALGATALMVAAVMSMLLVAAIPY